MILHLGDRVYWGAPEVIYLEGFVKTLDEDEQTAIVHIERATPHSAHLIGNDIPFAADGIMPLTGDSPPGTTSERNSERLPPQQLSDDDKVRSAAAVAVHQQYGYGLPAEQEQMLIHQVYEVINADSTMRTKVIASMDQILTREFL